MTPHEARTAVANIQGAIQDEYDDEKAHGLEDALYLAVLTAIANGETDNPQELASIALATQKLGHERWCG